MGICCCCIEFSFVCVSMARGRISFWAKCDDDVKRSAKKFKPTGMHEENTWGMEGTTTDSIKNSVLNSNWESDKNSTLCVTVYVTSYL